MNMTIQEQTETNGIDALIAKSEAFDLGKAANLVRTGAAFAKAEANRA